MCSSDLNSSTVMMSIDSYVQCIVRSSVDEFCKWKTSKTVRDTQPKLLRILLTSQRAKGSTVKLRYYRINPVKMLLDLVRFVL